MSSSATPSVVSDGEAETEMRGLRDAAAANQAVVVGDMHAANAVACEPRSTASPHDPPTTLTPLKHVHPNDGSVL